MFHLFSSKHSSESYFIPKSQIEEQGSSERSAQWMFTTQIIPQLSENITLLTQQSTCSAKILKMENL